MTAAELIAQAAKRLSDAGVPEPELDATADRGTENAAGDV